jgi:F-type H+-transporting ATPase subunit b
MPLTAEALIVAEAPENPLLPATYDIVWSSVVFVVVLFLFWRLVLPRYLALLDERTERIEGGLKKAEEAQAEAAALKEQFEAQLAEARADAGRAREEARAEGAAIIAQMRADAQAEAARIVESAQRTIEAERQQASSQLRQEVGRLAVQLSERIIGEAMTDDARQQRVIDRFLAEIEGDGGAEPAPVAAGRDGLHGATRAAPETSS